MDRARAMAIRAAREKAVALTAEINQVSGKAIEITKEPARTRTMNRNDVAFDSAPGSDDGTFARV